MKVDISRVEPQWARRRDRNLEQLLDRIDIPAFALDRNRKVIVWNDACARLTGLQRIDVLGTQHHWRGFYTSERPCLADLVHEGRHDQVGSYYDASGATAQHCHGLSAENWCDMPILGERRYLAIDAFAIHSSEGRRVAVVETLRDMTDLKCSQNALAANQQQLSIALNNMHHGLAKFDASDRLTLANDQFFALYGLDRSVVTPATTVNDLAQWISASSGDPNMTAENFTRFLLKARQKQHHRIMVDRPNGQVVAVSWRQLQDGGWVSTHEDVTLRRQAEREIEYLAQHDALTTLENRRSFLIGLEREVSASAKAAMFAVLTIDLDRFKDVNDEFGHPTGDELLIAVAKRLKSLVRAGDIVSRLGGDEFAVLQRDVRHRDDCETLATRIVEHLSQPYALEVGKVRIGASVGIAVSPTDGASVEALMRSSDIALYDAKDSGKGCHRFFEPKLALAMDGRRSLETDLREALRRGDLEVHYQPILDFRRKVVTSCEALVRWTHPTRGVIPPLEFVPVAEQVGLIDKLGRFVLARACRDACRWPASIKVAVNLSAVQFRNRRLCFDVLNALTQSGLAPHRLQLEITESVMVQEFDAATTIIEQLKALGVGIALDDFGTGYSSLSYLRRFPFDKIKIDRSFVNDLPLGTEANAIVKAVVDIGASLGMATTAEGVETLEQLDCLERKGCTEVQGWLFSKAIPSGEIDRFIQEQANVWELRTKTDRDVTIARVA